MGHEIRRAFQRDGQQRRADLGVADDRRRRPEEDEEISAEEEAAVQEARDEIAAGVPTIPLEQVMRELGDA
ncbi:MAG TPA: hypothetical protein VIJ70_10950 [Gaiellaceae bacterium]